MLYQRHPQNPPTHPKRKTKEGDWTCINCFNYNYAFRQYCNRCRSQEKHQNQRLMSAIGKENYGENSFPSVLFLQYPQRYPKETTSQSVPVPQKVLYVEKGPGFTQVPREKDICEDIDCILNENIWISNLIGE